jgi:hypothetical protein
VDVDRWKTRLIGFVAYSIWKAKAGPVMRLRYRTFFLCGFDWFRIDHFAIASHGFVNKFTKYSSARLPVSTLRLKPDECFWADVNYYSWHGCAKIGFNNIQ